jgi:hypothetical protein
VAGFRRMVIEEQTYLSQALPASPTWIFVKFRRCRKDDSWLISVYCTVLIAKYWIFVIAN